MNLSLKKYRYYTPELFAFIALIVLCLLLEWYSLAQFEKSFISYDNLVINVARQVSLNAIIACGMAFAILSGGIDLSVGAIVAEVREYVPGYEVRVPPMLDGDKVTTIVQVRGQGDFLPEYSGNLDIINAAAVAAAERLAEVMLGHGQ